MSRLAIEYRHLRIPLQLLGAVYFAANHCRPSSTPLDGDAVTLKTDHARLEDGLNYVARYRIDVPDKQVVLTSENFNYNRD